MGLVRKLIKLLNPEPTMPDPHPSCRVIHDPITFIGNWERMQQRHVTDPGARAAALNSLHVRGTTWKPN